MTCLSAQWREQQAEAARLDAAIDVSLPMPHFGD